MSTKTDKPIMTVGDRIRLRRHEMGLTQTQLAEKVGLSQRTISNIERNDTDLPRRENLIRIGAVLNINPGELYLAGSYNLTTHEAQRAEREFVADPSVPIYTLLLDDLRDLDVDGLTMIREIARTMKRHASK